MQFLDTIFADRGEKTRARLVNFIQEMMGYCLSNSVKAHKFFFLVGDGSNGKSVLCDVLTELAGGVANVSNVALRNFSKQFALSQIMDKTLNISTENEIEGSLDTQTLKAIVSGEAMQMEEKFKMPVSHRPTAKLIFAVNTLPKTGDLSFGFGRRVICIPFNMRFVEGKPKNENEREADPYLIDRLKGELDGIFKFAVDGLKRLKERDYKFVMPKVVRKATEEYEEMNDLYLAFVRECIISAPEADKELTQQDLLETFKEWCAQEGLAQERNVKTKPFMKKFRTAMGKAPIPFLEDTHNNKEYPLSEIRFSKRGIELWQQTFRGKSGFRYQTVKTLKDLEEEDELQM
jgi:putative DNA primase/helicase